MAGTRPGEITIELRRNATTVVAEVVGNVGATTTSRGDWIAANPEGRDKDRYFKYVSEYVLTSYGALDTGERNEAGEKIFAWSGPIETDDGQPLRQLDGTPITTAGYYDFTRRGSAGDGVEFIYESVAEKGKQVDYIVGMRFFLRNNVFGDNDPSRTNIRDPGAPVTILRELGVITNIMQNEITRIGASSIGASSITTMPLINAPLLNLATTNLTQQSIAATANALLALGSAGSQSSEATPQALGAENGNGAGIGDSSNDGANDGAAAGGRGQGDGGDSTNDHLGKGAGDRGLRLDPQLTLATINTAPDSLLDSLSDTSILGANLLDALTLGAGLLYLLYGPRSIDQSRRGLRGWLAGAANAGRRPSAAAAEQQVLSLLLTRQNDGSLSIVAAQITMSGVKLLAQHDLASAAGDEAALQQALSELMTNLNQKGAHYDLLLLDGQLDRAFSAAEQNIAGLAKQRLPLAPAELSAAVAAASPSEFVALQQWLNKPSLILPPESPVAQSLARRRAAYGQILATEQAQMAAMIELSLALTWSQR
jgi:hypothetical protein